IEQTNNGDTALSANE
nr:sphingomyelinase=40 kda {N-terminal, enterotoxin complex} [Bacillus cereus, Peptide Partial, 15 aa] [Bacillus cereus]